MPESRGIGNEIGVVARLDAVAVSALSDRSLLHEDLQPGHQFDRGFIGLEGNVDHLERIGHQDVQRPFHTAQRRRIAQRAINRETHAKMEFIVSSNHRRQASGVLDRLIRAAERRIIDGVVDLHAVLVPHDGLPLCHLHTDQTGVVEDPNAAGNLQCGPGVRVAVGFFDRVVELRLQCDRAPVGLEGLGRIRRLLGGQHPRQHTHAQNDGNHFDKSFASHGLPSRKNVAS